MEKFVDDLLTSVADKLAYVGTLWYKLEEQISTTDMLVISFTFIFIFFTYSNVIRFNKKLKNATKQEI